MIVAAWRTLYTEVITRQLEGDPVEELAVEHEAVIRHTFDVLARALSDGGPERS